MKKKLPSLQVNKKTGVRYIIVGKKKYRLVSDDSNSIILENISEILKTLMIKKKRKKRKAMGKEVK
jgi:hypothetical protein